MCGVEGGGRGKGMNVLERLVEMLWKIVSYHPG